MSMLQQTPGEQADDAARGESFTKGSSPIGWARGIAALIVTLAVGLYFWVGHKPPAATGEVLDVWTHAVHTSTPAYDAAGRAIPQETFDQVLVFTHARIHNQSSNRIFLHQIMTNATLADSVHTSYAAPISDYTRIFVAYPELKQWQSAPLASEITLEPGQTAEGTFVSSFRLAKDQWDARKGLSYRFAFRYLPALQVEYKGAVTAR